MHIYKITDEHGFTFFYKTVNINEAIHCFVKRFKPFYNKCELRRGRSFGGTLYKKYFAIYFDNENYYKQFLIELFTESEQIEIYIFSLPENELKEKMGIELLTI